MSKLQKIPCIHLETQQTRNYWVFIYTGHQIGRNLKTYLKVLVTRFYRQWGFIKLVNIFPRFFSRKFVTLFFLINIPKAISTLSSNNNRYILKKKQKNKHVCIYEIMQLIIMKIKAQKWKIMPYLLDTNRFE